MSVEAGKGAPHEGLPRLSGLDRVLGWRAIRDPALSGARNMAIDEALARTATPGTAVLRLYGWSRPTLSFGRNEPSAGRYDEDLARDLSVDFVRRPTGGRAVLHDSELTYSVTVSVGAIGGLRATYRSVNEALVVALEALGIPVTMAPANGLAPGPSAGPCFDVPAPGEVMALGNKLVGSAQVRIGRTILQHGSIILSGDQGMIARLGGADQARPPATILGLLGELPARSRIEQALVDGFRQHFGGEWSDSELTPSESRLASRLESRYRSHEWIWRV